MVGALAQNEHKIWHQESLLQAETMYLGASWLELGFLLHLFGWDATNNAPETKKETFEKSVFKVIVLQCLLQKCTHMSYFSYYCFQNEPINTYYANCAQLSLKNLNIAGSQKNLKLTEKLWNNKITALPCKLSEIFIKISYFIIFWQKNCLKK